MAYRPFLHTQTPIAFAHRGGGKLWPENTLLAFRGALELGYQYIETDVHLTRDNEIVVFHDPTLTRTTNGIGLLADRTLKELKRLDAGYRFQRESQFPFRGQNVTVPTLTEALDLSPHLRLNIEIKVRSARMAGAMWDYIAYHGLHERVLVASEHSPTGKSFSRLSKGRVATSAGTSETIAFWAAAKAGVSQILPKRYDALQVPIQHGPMRIVTPNFLAAAHRSNLQVHVWTIDDPSTIQQLLSLGVDGIMTDRPDLLKQALKRDGPT